MADDGKRLAKIEEDLARMERELRADKEQRLLFQDRTEFQLSQLLDLVKVKGPSHNDEEEDPPSRSFVDLDKALGYLPELNGDGVEDDRRRLSPLKATCDETWRCHDHDDEGIQIASFRMFGPMNVSLIAGLSVGFGLSSHQKY